MSDYIAKLQSVFLKLHGCDVTYVETVPVVEEFPAQRSGRAMSRYLISWGIRKQREVTGGDM